MPKVKLKNITLYYEVHGKGFPLLLIAGLGSDSSSWLGVVHKLSKNFQVIVFDNRGSGRSNILDKKYSIRQMADDVIKLLDYLNIKKCHIIGHSMGGFIAQELAIHYPKRIDKLILEATSPVCSRRNNVLFNNFLIQLQRNNDIKSWFKQWTFWLFSPKLFNKKKFIATFIENASKYPYKQPAIGFQRQIEAMALFNTSSRIKNVKTNTLIIAGSNDILINPWESRMLAKDIHNSSFVTIENTAHCIHIENLGAFIKVVMDFLSK